VTAAGRWRLGEAPWLEPDPRAPGPRFRVLVDNDFAGDPDGLVQLAHHLLSPSVEIRGVIGSHLPVGGPFPPVPDSAARACAKVAELFDVMGLDAGDVVHEGSALPLGDRSTPRESAAVRAILAEAFRDDPRPLYLACGGGLTDLASAWLVEPSLASRITLVWIGGPAVPEFNVSIDPVAAEVVLGSDIPLWQVPRDVYRSCEVPLAELRRRMAPQGRLGGWLHDRLLEALHDYVWPLSGGRSEAFCLGDSPLVLLTALQSGFDPDTTAAEHVDRPDGPPGRVYTRLDTRFMVEDLFAKLAEFADWQASG